MRRFRRSVEFLALPAAAELCAAAADMAGVAAGGPGNVAAAGGVVALVAVAAVAARVVCLLAKGTLDSAFLMDKEGTRSGGTTGNSGPNAAGIVTPGTSNSFNIPLIVSCILSQNLSPTSISILIFLAVRELMTCTFNSSSSASRFLVLLLTLAASSVVLVVSFLLVCRTRCRLSLCTLAVDREKPFNACPPSNCRETQSVLSFQLQFATSAGTSFSGTTGKGGGAFPFGGGMLGCCCASVAGGGPTPVRDGGAVVRICWDDDGGGCDCGCGGIALV